MYNKGIIKKGEFFDSVTLMLIAKEINKLPGVIDSAVVMGTKENRAILKSSNILLPEFEKANETDLLIAIKAESEQIATNAFEKIEKLLFEIKHKNDNIKNFYPKSFESALKILPDANLCLISIAGKYAAQEALKALDNGLNVMIFSDNVSLEDEIKLKNYAAKKKLLLMGPDCGTAIINGVPLAFANATNKGNIGIIAASGTGLQEVSSLISEAGCGISQAIGTGSRDIKDEVGGIMFIESLKALGKDDNTKIILLISKPPHPNTLNKIINETKKINKPIIALFLGAKPDLISKTGIIYANTLEESALIAVALSKNDDCKSIQNNAYLKDLEISKLAQKLASKTKGKYLRGLYSGGTLCYEAQLILSNYIDEIYSNTPINNKFKLKNSLKSINNTVIDLGDDEFTIGKPHPMIYFSLRMKQLYEEAKNKEVGVILMDIVLGYGANLNPLNDIIPVIKKIKKIRKDLIIICPIIGTAKDPQNKNEIIHSLTNNGVIVAESNAYASKLAGNIIKLKGVEYVF